MKAEELAKTYSLQFLEAVLQIKERQMQQNGNEKILGREESQNSNIE